MGTRSEEEDDVKYLLQVYADDELQQQLPEEARQAAVGEYRAIFESPAVLDGNQLQPVDTATTVRVRDGQTLLTDGPFVDAKEHLGGYYVVEADDLDAALEIAARVPATRMGGGVEVRPLVEG